MLKDFQCAIEHCNYPVYSGKLCNHHTDSDEKLKVAFEQWQEAYDDNITWEEYLHLLADRKISGVGKYIVELANYYLQEEGKDTEKYLNDGGNSF